MNNKKSQMGVMGFRTVMMWILIILIGIVLMILLARSTDFGMLVWGKIKNLFPFI